jgi:hypothetical protein
MHLLASMVLSFQHSRAADRRLTLSFSQSIMTFESPRSSKAWMFSLCARMREAHAPSSSAFVLVPCPPFRVHL